MSNKLKIILVYILITVIWGTTWLVIRVGLEAFPPLIASGLRFLVASILLAAIIWYKKIPVRLDRHAVIVYLYMSLFSVIFPFWFVYWGEQYVNSGLASVLFGIYPFSVAILTRIFLPDEKITFLKVAGLVMGFAGIIVIFSDSFTGNFSNQVIGMLAILGSGILQSTVVIVVRKYGKDLHSVSMNFIPMLLGAIGFFILGYFIERHIPVHPTSQGIFSFVYLGLFGSVIAYTAYYWLLKRMDMVLLAFSAFLTPIVALFVGWLFLNEYLTKNHFYGTLLVLIGLLISNITMKKIRSINPE